MDIDLGDGFIFKDENWGDIPEKYKYTPSPYDKICNPNNLYHAYLLYRKSVAWKESVQRYGINLLSNIVKAIDSISNGTYSPKVAFEFKLKERGHDRHIKALEIFDRVIQRSLNDNVLIPAVTPHLIYDNGASQTGKGVTFSRDRFAHHMYQALCTFGMNSYVLLIDFSKYFDNILHKEMLEQIKPLVSPEEFQFIEMIFDSFKIDVSYMSDEEYDNCLVETFNSLDYENIDKSLLTGEKFMEKSVGIGSQISQVSGIFYPHTIDNYCTIVRGYGLYCRYMDDTAIFGQTKEELESLLIDIEKQCEPLGIHINKKKTRIQPLMSQITYLKINHIILPSGRIIREVPKETFRREERRLKKFKHLYDEGKMSLVDILKCYISWQHSYWIYDSSDEIYRIDYVFRQLFNFDSTVDLQDLMRRLIKNEQEQERQRLFSKI